MIVKRFVRLAAAVSLNFHWCPSSSQFSLGSQEDLEKRTTYHMENEEKKESKSTRRKRKSDKGGEDTDSAKSGEFDDEESAGSR